QVTDVTPDKPYSQSLITDGQGDTLVVSKKGQVMGVKEYKFAGDDRHLLNEYHRQLDSLGDWQINFNSAKAKQTYAFDQIGSGNHGIFATDEYYPKSGNYDFRYKSVECGKNDKVIVDFGAYPEKDSVIFKDKYGVKLKVVDGNILSFTGVSKADTNFIYAYRGDKKIGKLFLNTYQRKIYNVVLVSVNEAKILHEKNVEKAVKKVEESLNIVYNQCAVKFEISTDKITINDLPSFSHGGSGILTVYNDDQKKVLSAYEKEKKMTDGVYYLFFIDNVTDKKDGSGTPVSGYMPRGYNAGFIYDGGSPHTIAHELGHGIAGLEHVFENSNASGKTANLMDYASGEELWHFQWDQIQDPSRVWMKWNKAEEEGENQIEPEPELRNLYKYPIPDSPVSGIFIAPSEWPIWINDVKNVYVLAPSYYGISLNDSQRPDAAIYGFATSVDPENFYMAKFSEKGHFEGFYKGDVLYVDKDNETLNHYHQTGSPVYYWDISSRTLLNNLYVAPKTPVGDEWSPNSYSAVMPDIIEIERQNRLEELLKKKNDGQWQFWFYDVKNNKIVVVYDYTGGRLLRTQNRQTIALKDIQDADIESMSQKEYANSDYNWLANDVRSTMNEAGTYVAEGMAVILAAPYLLDAALVGEGVSGKFAQGFLSDFVSNSVANMVTYFIVEHWINDNPKKTWNEYFDFKEMVLDASIAGAKNLYAPASLKGKLLYDAAVDGIQAVNVRELLDNETTFLDQVVNFGIGAGVAVIVDAITPRLTRKLAKHSFTKTLDFVQLRKAVTSTTFAKNEKFVSVINQLLAGVAVPKVFKFSTNIDEKQFRKIVGDLLNTDQGAMSLNIIRRSSKEFTSVEEFEKLAGNLVSSLDNVNISNCNDIVNNISSKIIDGIADLCLSNHHYANTVVFLNKLFTSKLSNKADILNVCFTHQHSALLVGDLGRLIDKYDIGDLISNISSFKSYRTLSEQLSGKYGSRESARLMFDFLFSHHFEANKIDDYMSGVEVKEIDGIITMLESTGGLDLMDLLKGASAEVDDELLFACTNLYTYFRKGINSTDFDYVQKIFKINYNKNKEWWKQPFAEIADVYKRYRFSKDGVTPHLELLAMDIDGMTSEFSKVFKFSTNIDKRHLKSVVDNLLKNTEKGRQSLLLLSRGTKQFNNISEFETVVNKVNQCFSEIKSDDCNSIIRDLSSHNNSPEIIKGIANLCLSDHSATNVKFLTKLFNSNIKNKADIVDYCIKHKHTDLLVDDLDWIFNSTKIDDFISQISSFESFSDLSANLLGRGREQAAKLIFDFLLSHHFEANIINKYMSGENVQEIIDIRQMLSSSGGLDLMDLLKKASVSVDRDLLSACKNLYGKFKGGMQQMDIDYAIRVFENNKNPKQTIVDLTEVYNSFSSSDATRYLELLANDRKASLSLLTDDVDISLASVAMSDTGPFRASLPVKYQEYNITHLLIKTEDNKPAYVKVIDGVKRYAVVLIQKNEKDWVVFGLVLSSVGGDVAKNGDFQEAIKEEIKYIINEIKKRSDK
ncbi:MAG: hypothetical protein J6Z01_05225, partial [Bacteroidales bacterium]|nr:hypothetical protein [Bacteroidales bacterium]